ncbi:hypothetical protein CEXT_338651 [Caerostris extrusa]|uniref:Uncharacterized protein n=1 Tax=Caerostris extrusa TaxID=172846 RepID=A0AAV4S4F1_CAEEX|nr:hypothetical protein CEXT_338651 [Caerostris extrusa]
MGAIRQQGDNYNMTGMSSLAAGRKWFMGQPRALARPLGPLQEHPVRKLNQRAETNITWIGEFFHRKRMLYGFVGFEN